FAPHSVDHRAVDHAHDRTLDRLALERAHDRLLGHRLDGALDAGRARNALGTARAGPEQPFGKRWVSRPVRWLVFHPKSIPPLRTSNTPAVPHSTIAICPPWLPSQSVNAMTRAFVASGAT